MFKKTSAGCVVLASIYDFLKKVSFFNFSQQLVAIHNELKREKKSIFKLCLGGYTSKERF